ncbi:unnamed protein product [marine sediment metagenome]|uniref:Class II aldolase/adducin N-terminal domain-containing protein n=1 Tax=marine sediment metagenome TaxID=412755 RepID=X1D873_9ZZZZ
MNSEFNSAQPHKQRNYAGAGELTWLTHEEVDALALVARELLAKEFFCLANVGSPAQVGKDDVFVLQMGQ